MSGGRDGSDSCWPSFAAGDELSEHGTLSQKTYRLGDFAVEGDGTSSDLTDDVLMKKPAAKSSKPSKKKPCVSDSGLKTGASRPTKTRKTSLKKPAAAPSKKNDESQPQELPSEQGTHTPSILPESDSPEPQVGCSKCRYKGCSKCRAKVQDWQRRHES